MKKEEAKDIVKQIKEAKDELSSINSMNDDNLIAESIVKGITTINILLISFSPYLADLWEEVAMYENKEEEIFTRTYMDNIKSNSTQKNAEMEARIERLELREKKIPVEKLYRSLVDFKKDIERFVMGLNTRLSYLKAERMKEIQ